MRKFKSIGIKERTDLIYTLGLQNDYHNITQSKEEILISNCIKCIDFFKLHRRYPYQTSTDACERSLAKWHASMRQKLKVYIDNNIPHVLLELASKHKFPRLFHITDKEAINIDICKKVIEFINTNNKYPYGESPDDYERRLGQWVSAMKSAKAGKGHRVLYPSVVKLMIEAGHSTIFERVDLEAVAIDKCNQVINFIKIQGRHPSLKSYDRTEIMLCRWVNRMISAKSSNSSKRHTFYSILDDMVNANGCSGIFDKMDKKGIAIQRFNQVIEFIQKTGRFPSHESTNEYEKSLNHWLTNKRCKNRAVDKYILNCLIQLAIKAGYPNMFNSNWRDDLRK